MRHGTFSMKLAHSRQLVVGACFVLWLGANEVRAGGACTFVRGNIINDTGVNIVDFNDAVDLIAFIFEGKFVSDIPCVDAGDFNDDGLVTMADYTYLVDHIFNNGPPPPPPFPDPGVDPTPGVITVSGIPDPRFRVSMGSAAGVPNNTGLSIPITISNDEPIWGLTLVFQYDPLQIRVDEIITEENTLLSSVSADYIIASFDNSAGVAWITSLRDFAVPFYFINGDDPTMPAGTDQLVALMKVALPPSATQGVTDIEFVDGAKLPNTRNPPVPDDLLVEVHNLVFDGSTPIRPELSNGSVSIRRGFVRGDANMDRSLDIADPIKILNFLFTGTGDLPCADAADANNDTRLNLADPLWVLNFLFRGGPQPSEPYPQPGVDPSDDGSGSLGCADDEPSP